MLSLNSFKVNNKDQSFRNGFQHVLTLISQHISFYPTSNSLSYLWGFGLLLVLNIFLFFLNSGNCFTLVSFFLEVCNQVCNLTDTLYLAYGITMDYVLMLCQEHSYILTVANSSMTSLLGLSISFADSTSTGSNLSPYVVSLVIHTFYSLWIVNYGIAFAYKVGYDQHPFFKSFLRHMLYWASSQLLVVVCFIIMEMGLFYYFDIDFFNEYYGLGLLSIWSSLYNGLYSQAYSSLITYPLLYRYLESWIAFYVMLLVVGSMFYVVVYWMGLHKNEDYFKDNNYYFVVIKDTKDTKDTKHTNDIKHTKESNIFALFVGLSLAVVKRTGLYDKVQIQCQKIAKHLQSGVFISLGSWFKITISAKACQVLGGVFVIGGGIYQRLKNQDDAADQKLLKLSLESQKQLLELNLASKKELLNLTLASLEKQQTAEVELERVKGLNQVMHNILNNPAAPQPENLLSLRKLKMADNHEPFLVKELINASKEVDLIRRNQTQPTVQDNPVVNVISEVIASTPAALDLEDQLVILPDPLDTGWESSSVGTRSLSVIDSHGDSSNQLNEYNNNLKT